MPYTATFAEPSSCVGASCYIDLGLHQVFVLDIGIVDMAVDGHSFACRIRMEMAGGDMAARDVELDKSEVPVKKSRYHQVNWNPAAAIHVDV